MISVNDVVKINALPLEGVTEIQFTKYFSRFQASVWQAIGVPPTQITDFNANPLYNRPGTPPKMEIGFDVVGLNRIQEEEFNRKVCKASFRDDLQERVREDLWGTGIEPTVGQYINIDEDPSAVPGVSTKWTCEAFPVEIKPPSGSNVGLTIGLIALALVLVLGGAVVYLWCQKNKYQSIQYGSGYTMVNALGTGQTKATKAADREL